MYKLREEILISSLLIWDNFMDKRHVDEILKEHTEELMAIPGVVAVAVGESGGKPCLRVFVTDMNARSLRDIPDDIEGYGVLITKSGKFQARKKL